MVAAKSQQKTSDKSPDTAGLSPQWLRKFLWALVIGAATISLAMWSYSAWGYFGVVKPVRTVLAAGEDAGLAEAVETLSTAHIFAGYEAYHGFGDERSGKRAETLSRVVARGTEYSPTEQRVLIQQVAYFIPAFLEHKVQGSVPVVSGDRLVVETLLERWTNGWRAGIAFGTYATVVTALLSLLLGLYYRFNLFARVDGPPRAE